MGFKSKFLGLIAGLGATASFNATAAQEAPTTHPVEQQAHNAKAKTAASQFVERADLLVAQGIDKGTIELEMSSNQFEYAYIEKDGSEDYMIMSRSSEEHQDGPLAGTLKGQYTLNTGGISYEIDGSGVFTLDQETGIKTYLNEAEANKVIKTADNFLNQTVGQNSKDQKAPTSFMQQANDMVETCIANKMLQRETTHSQMEEVSIKIPGTENYIVQSPDENGNQEYYIGNVVVNEQGAFEQDNNGTRTQLNKEETQGYQNQILSSLKHYEKMGRAVATNLKMKTAQAKQNS